MPDVILYIDPIHPIHVDKPLRLIRGLKDAILQQTDVITDSEEKV